MGRASLLLAIALGIAPAGAALPAAAGDGPLVELEGSVHPLVDLEAAVGTLSVEAGEPGADLRADPGPVTLETTGGALSAGAGVPLEARRVDPASGRPLLPGAPAGASCTTGAEAACWTPGDPAAPSRALFDALCELTVGFSPLDPEACALDLFESDAVPSGSRLSVANLFSVVLAGSPLGRDDILPAFASAFSGGVGLDTTALDGATAEPGKISPLVDLSMDPTDGDLGDEVPGFAAALELRLTDEQEALLGCGPFYGSRCDRDGMRLFHAEVGALLPAFPIDAEGRFLEEWDALDESVAQPGTPDFDGPPACRRSVEGETWILPGCAGPLRAEGSPSPVYDPAVDGSVSGAVHPFTGQTFESEMAAFSWNLLVLYVVASAAPRDDVDGDGFPDDDRDGDGTVDRPFFDPSEPVREEGCSFARPVACRAVQSLLLFVVRELDDDPGGPPRRRWLWESGSAHPVGSASGTEAAFEGGTLHLAGPEPARLSGGPVGAVLVVRPPPGAGTVPAPSLLADVGSPGPDGVPDSGDEPWLGSAYVVPAPEPGASLLAAAALLALAALAKGRARAEGERA